MDRNNRIIEQIRQNPKLVVSDDFEIAIIDRVSKRRIYMNGSIDENTVSKETWSTLRLLQRKSPGVASVSGDSKEALQHLIECGSKASEASKVDPWFRFPLWRSQVLNSQTEIPALSEAEEECSLKSHYPSLSKKPFVFLEEHQVAIENVTLFRKKEKTVLRRGRRSFQTSFNLLLNRDAGWFREEKKSPSLKTTEQQEMLAELLGSSLQMCDAKSYDGKPLLRYVLGPRVTAFLLQQNEELFVARSYKTENPLEKGISEVLTLVDDGTLNFLTESTSFDMEGSISERTLLVEKGVFKTLLHDTQSATKENRLSTGNFVVKSGQKFSGVGFTNFFVEVGDENDLVGCLEDGVVLQRIEAVEKRSNESLRLWLSGFLVRGGRLIEPVRRVPLILPISEFLRDAKKVGQDLEFFGNIGSPSILFEKNP